MRNNPKESGFSYEEFLKAYLQVEEIMKNRYFEQKSKNKSLYSGAKRECAEMVDILEKKLKEISETRSIPSEKELEVIFKLLALYSIFERMSFAKILTFFIVYTECCGADYRLDNILQTPIYEEKLRWSSYRKQFAILAVKMVDVNVKGPLSNRCGQHMLIEWLLGKFDDFSAMMAEVAARVMFLEKTGVITKNFSDERKIIEAYEPFVNEEYGFFNDDEIEKYITKSWVKIGD